ncbi:MAG: RNA methyltransferase substrate-binding domain-containing protein, partial [Gaiellaceae bacterium]
MIVYGRNPVREALRGKRSVSRVWATQAASRGADWLGAADPKIVRDADLEALCGSPEHQGVCAEASDYPYADG